MLVSAVTYCNMLSHTVSTLYGIFKSYEWLFEKFRRFTACILCILMCILIKNVLKFYRMIDFGFT